MIVRVLYRKSSVLNSTKMQPICLHVITVNANTEQQYVILPSIWLSFSFKSWGTSLQINKHMNKYHKVYSPSWLTIYQNGKLKILYVNMTTKITILENVSILEYI